MFGFRSSWDGRDRRSGLRAQCDFEVQADDGRWSGSVAVADLCPRGARLIVSPCPAGWREGTPVTLSGVRARITRIQRRSSADGGTPVALDFCDSLGNLCRSWVKRELAQRLRQRLRQQRAGVRVACRLPVSCRVHGGLRQGQLLDLSVEGGRLALDQPLAVGARLQLQLAGVGPLQAIVRRAAKDGYGLQFISASPGLLDLVRQRLRA